MWFGNPRWMPRQQCALSIGLDGKIYFLEATNMIAPKLYELFLTMFFYVDRKIQDACHCWTLLPFWKQNI